MDDEISLKPWDVQYTDRAGKRQHMQIDAKSKGHAMNIFKDKVKDFDRIRQIKKV